MIKQMPTVPDRDAEGRSWGHLPTEARHPASGELDRMSSEQIVRLVLEEDRRGLERAGGQAMAIANAADWLAETVEKGGTVLFAGAGTSGRLGVLEAAECPPTFGTDPNRIRAAMAGGQAAVFAAVEGAEDSAADGEAAASALGAGDLLLAISASSVTPFVQAALAQARRRGARTVLLTCAAGGGGYDADLVLALDTGPEILSGSTRLKAGSATKAALNAITTAAMVRLGKVFENFMVDLRPGSEKLRDRAIRIVASAGRVSRQQAEQLWRDCQGEVKTAVVVARAGVTPDVARERLRRAQGHVRRALEEP